MDNSSYEGRIESAIEALESQDKPNYRATAKKHNVNHTTLRRRFLGEQLPLKVANSEFRQRLTLDQEECLVQQINRLSERSISPTSCIVKNLAEEIIGGPVGKNWTGDFVKRYGPRLTSLYLRVIDNARKKAEYPPTIELFFDQVSEFLYFILCFYYLK